MRLLVAVSIAGILSAAPSGQVATFKSGVDLVSFSVTVSDKKSLFVTDLKKSDFELYEDGKKQTLTYFTAGTGLEGDVAAADLHLGVLFDISGSMDEDLSLSRTAAIKFLKTLDDARDMTLVDFDTEVRVAQYSPADFPNLVERIRTRKAEGMTAFYDAVGVYLHGASKQDGRKILVLYTDGDNNSSEITFTDTLNLLKASDVTVYSIGLLEHAGSSAGRFDLKSRLRQMAEITGGQSFFPMSIEDLDGVYEKIRDEIRAQYVVGYVSTNTNADGKWRKVDVKVVRPGANVKVRTRKGYFAPYR